MSISSAERVSVISEALPYIKKFSGKAFVVKYGGSGMQTEHLKKVVIEDIAFLHYVGVKPTLVHGGGKEINYMLSKLDLKSEFFQGLRVTDQPTMEVVEMVLTGKIQKELVGLLNQAGAKAIGLSGKDGELLTAQKLSNQEFDWGLTGEIIKVNSHVLEILSKDGYLPVISSVAADPAGKTLNVNADDVAASLAVDLQAEKLILLTDMPGLLADPEDKSTLIRHLTVSEAQDRIKDGSIRGGMIPKIQSAIKTLEAGVKAVHILDGTLEHVLLLEIFTEEGAGTMISRD
ncbi:MAG: acetylglutamate kinase [Candidatus Caenarcaniphilales bacterium]|nr:acetylglutamate kinase [Candidatus Caenarcaniphilales bacterium]